MVSARSATVVSVTALAAYIQYCPAPVLAPLALVAGSVAARAATMIPRVVQGTVKVAKAAEKVNDAVDTVTTVNDAINGDNEEKRDVHDMHVIRTFNRVDYLAARQDPNQRAWQLCREQLGNATVTFSAPAQGEVLTKGVPPACMTLSGVMTDKYNEGHPVPMGVDSMLFTGLTDETIDQIEDALTSRQQKKA